MNSQVIDTGVSTALSGAKKWAKGCAWIMLIYLAFIVLSGFGAVLVSGDPFREVQMLGSGGWSTIVGAVSFLAMAVPPIVYLFGFVRNSEAALASGNPAAFASALTSLKSFFKYYVIMVIVIAVIYALMLAALAGFI